MDLQNILGKVVEKGKEVVSDFGEKTNVLTMFEYIKSAKNIATIGHDKIDGDSLGSTLAMKKWIENKFPEKNVIAYTNRKYPEVFEFLKPDIKYGENLKLDKDTDLIIVLDAANLERLGPLYDNNKEVFEKATIINIDHHVSNDKFAAINLVDSQAPATAQFLYEILNFLDKGLNNLINQTKKGLDAEVATYLLMGILTDTQNFTIPLSNDKTLEIAAELIRLGARKQDLINNIFLNKKLEELKLQAIAIDRIQKIEKNGLNIYFSYLTKEDFEKFNLDIDESSVSRTMPSLLLSISDADIIAFWKIKDEETSVSFRTKKDNIDVNQIAAKLGGGGHKAASGAKLDKVLNPEEIKQTMEELW